MQIAFQRVAKNQRLVVLVLVKQHGQPALAAGLVLSACVSSKPVEPPKPPVVEKPVVKPMSYLPDDTADDARDLDLVGDQLPPEPFRRAEIDFQTEEPVGTVIVDTSGPALLLSAARQADLPVLPVNLMSSVKMRESHQACKPLIFLDPLAKAAAAAFGLAS